MKEARGWRRVVIEKPFGHDLASAKALNRRVLKVVEEKQVFRIDHFLGKETVQNIMVMRFANGLFEPIWNRDHIDHVQITASETVGVEDRGAFYDATGALRDMTPNHMFQLLAMTAMEPPTSFDADAVRTEKAQGGGRRDQAADQAAQALAELACAANIAPGRGRRSASWSTTARKADDVAADSQYDRDLCRNEAGGRQLALGGRPLLPPHRQGAGGARHRGRDPVQAGAVGEPVPRHAGRPAAAQRAGAADPAATRASICTSVAKVPGPSRCTAWPRGVDMDFRYADWFKIAAQRTGYRDPAL